ncbi:WXG100 family type VII secretion target [Streptomyces sp. NPDC088921]|uniref:WXG100 family type VII secretion target n=1 Tax=unclassified Streptomyces TaxID=2593676 RepID=UPI0034140950
MALQNQVDDATVRRMMGGLTRTDADCDAAQRSVDASRSYLTSQWDGQAANTYSSALGNWLAGLAKVQRGVRELVDAMHTYYGQTNVTEADNTQSASWT